MHTNITKNKLEAERWLGIWMDHSNAHLIEFSPENLAMKTIESAFKHQDKMHSLSKSESQMHNKEQHLHATYYKKLGEMIRHYSRVLLFGPTDAKVELFNLLRSDHLFSLIDIELKQTDKMTSNQEHAFVNEYFSAKVVY